MSNFREEALRAIDNVEWIPAIGKSILFISNKYLFDTAQTVVLQTYNCTYIYMFLLRMEIMRYVYTHIYMYCVQAGIV